MSFIFWSFGLVAAEVFLLFRTLIALLLRKRSMAYSHIIKGNIKKPITLNRWKLMLTVRQKMGTRYLLKMREKKMIMMMTS